MPNRVSWEPGFSLGHEVIDAQPAFVATADRDMAVIGVHPCRKIAAGRRRHTPARQIGGACAQLCQYIIGHAFRPVMQSILICMKNNGFFD